MPCTHVAFSGGNGANAIGYRAIFLPILDTLPSFRLRDTYPSDALHSNEYSALGFEFDHEAEVTLLAYKPLKFHDWGFLEGESW
jgi:hypothetical protein